MSTAVSWKQMRQTSARTSSIDLASPEVSQSTSTCPTAALEPHTESITPVQWGHQLRQQA